MVGSEAQEVAFVAGVECGAGTQAQQQQQQQAAAAASTPTVRVSSPPVLSCTGAFSVSTPQCSGEQRCGSCESDPSCDSRLG